jgi:hypothetical protein
MTERCRSGAGCDQPAGHGLRGTFCEAHAEQLARVREQLSRRGPAPGARKIAVTPKPEPKPPEEADSMGRLPQEVRVRRLLAFLRDHGPASREACARAAGYSSPLGGYGRVARRVVAEGKARKLPRSAGGGLTLV